MLHSVAELLSSLAFHFKIQARNHEQAHEALK